MSPQTPDSDVPTGHHSYTCCFDLLASPLQLFGCLPASSAEVPPRAPELTLSAVTASLTPLNHAELNVTVALDAPGRVFVLVLRE